jgi:hypothetical protein
VTSKPYRKPDGVWFGQKGARKQGLSAVLSTNQINPWNFAAHRARLIRNPWATAALPQIAFGATEFNLMDGVFQKTDGIDMGNIFGLATGWPEDCKQDGGP